MKGAKFTGIPYWLGGLLLGVLNVGLFWFSGKPLGVTTAFSYWGATLAGWFGAQPDTWRFFSQQRLQNEAGDYQPLLYGSLLIMGIILGALMSTTINREFRIRWARNKKQYGAAILGGILMGYGARLAGGCSVGALVSGTASLSLHGSLFGIFMFLGVWLGLKVSQKIFYI